MLKVEMFLVSQQDTHCQLVLAMNPCDQQGLQGHAQLDITQFHCPLPPRIGLRIALLKLDGEHQQSLAGCSVTLSQCLQVLSQLGLLGGRCRVATRMRASCRWPCTLRRPDSCRQVGRKKLALVMQQS